MGLGDVTLESELARIGRIVVSAIDRGIAAVTEATLSTLVDATTSAHSGSLLGVIALLAQ